MDVSYHPRATRQRPPSTRGPNKWRLSKMEVVNLAVKPSVGPRCRMVEVGSGVGRLGLYDASNDNQTRVTGAGSNRPTSSSIAGEDSAEWLSGQCGATSEPLCDS
ncbi:hypothetical protein FRC08_012285 [Ceratobasidium sp. 394]|nr:hypothetical protein FRC08_012285 [Ceratobasidium sp. 394]